jgi:hypothetical protein
MRTFPSFLSSILGLGLALLAPSVSSAQSTPPPQITVSGAAAVKVVPDEIHLRVGVETRHVELAEAVRSHDQAMTNALRFLKTCGLPDQDVQTDFISVQPDYDHTSHTVPRAYIVRKSIGIRLTTTTNFAAVVTGLLKNGVNQIHNVDFRTAKLRQYRDQARAMAVKAAREKAHDLAKELGVKCGKPLNVHAVDYSGWAGGSSWGGYGQNYLNNSFNGVQNITVAAGDADATGDTLALGQISVSANVTASFLIE